MVDTQEETGITKYLIKVQLDSFETVLVHL